MTVRFAGFNIPLTDTLSDPFRLEIEVLLMVVFAVLFTPIIRCSGSWGNTDSGRSIFCMLCRCRNATGSHDQSSNYTKGKWDNQFHEGFVTRRFVCFYYYYIAWHCSIAVQVRMRDWKRR